MYDEGDFADYDYIDDADDDEDNDGGNDYDGGDDGNGPISPHLLRTYCFTFIWFISASSANNAVIAPGDIQYVVEKCEVRTLENDEMR